MLKVISIDSDKIIVEDIETKEKKEIEPDEILIENLEVGNIIELDLNQN